MLTALMLTGRVGSGIAAELGSMVVTDQINALRALGTDPIRKLVVPRVLAGFLMAPVLTVISDFVGIIGGWIVARFQLQVAIGPLLVVGHRGPVHAGRLDGAHQAVRARLRHRHDRLPRRAADDGRHAGRRQGDDRSPSSPARSAVIAVDFFVTQTADFAAVSEPWTDDCDRNDRTSRDAPTPDAPVIVFDHVSAGVRRQGRAEGRQLHAAARATRRSSSAPAAPGSRRSLKIITGPAAGRRRRRLGERPAGRSS